MYGYFEDLLLTKEDILLKYSQEYIFSLIFNEIPDINKRYISPFRNDNAPNCKFTYYNDILFFVDFGDTITHRNCFKALSDYYNISEQEVYSFIENASKDIKPSKKLKQTNKTKEVKLLSISYKRRNFNLDDYNYWNNYEISLNQLLSDGVFGVYWIKFNYADGSVKVVRNNKPMYVIKNFGNDKIKVYTPLTEIKRWKWFTNTSKNDIGNYHNIPISGEKLIITKSYKDFRVLQNNTNYSVIWFQNEGMIPDDTIIKTLCKRFNKITILFDNDVAGVKASKKLVSFINSLYPEKSSSVSIPKSLSVKDSAELISTYNRKELVKFMSQHKLC